jgi:hypothetical protein
LSANVLGFWMQARPVKTSLVISSVVRNTSSMIALRLNDPGFLPCLHVGPAARRGQQRLGLDDCSGLMDGDRQPRAMAPSIAFSMARQG